MPSGRLAAVDITAGTNTLIYQSTDGRAFNVTIRICNRNDTDIKVRLALSSGGLSTLTDADWCLEYDTPIRANGSIEHYKVSIANLQSIIGYSDTSNVSFYVGGTD